MGNKSNQIFIGLGSNLGDSVQNLVLAVQYLQVSFETKITTSSVYYSEPVEVRDQPWFYNQVASFETNKDISPIKVLSKLKEIETIMGRISTYRYGPRLIDLDLIFYKNWVFESRFLTIPHPKIEERAFVLQPMLELAPDYIHPRTLQPLRIIYQNSNLSQCQKKK